MPPRRALSIRQPYAELILRGEKTIEYRSRPTRLIGQRFYIYASKNSGQWSDVSGQIPADGLPKGVIVGSAVITHCTEGTRAGRPCHQWHLSNVKRIKPRKPKGQPQPVWFKPF